MYMAKISIIIPCYNQEKYIAECLDSVIAQTYQDWEAIVIDDGSQDGSLAIIQEYAKKNTNKIKVIHQTNQGVVVARNNAIRQATGEYIYPLDGDDIIEPTCLEKLYKHKEDGDVIYSRVQRFGLINEELVLKTPSIWNMSLTNQVVVSALYHKSDWEKYGGYDVKMKDGLEDWEFWLNFVENSRKFYCVPEKLLNYRILQNSRNRTAEVKKLRRYIYRKHWKILLARILPVIGRFFFQKKITKSGKKIVKICKIPVYRRKHVSTD